MMEQPQQEVWGRSRLRPRSMPLPPRSESELFTAEAPRPRSAGQNYARQYPLEPEPTPIAPPERETPRGPDEATGHSAGVYATIRARVHATWVKIRQNIGKIPKLARKARQARVPPPPELPWPLECAGTWRRLFVRVVLVFSFLSFAVPFAFGFVVFTARRVMLMTRTPVYLPIHEPLLDLADAVLVADWELSGEMIGLRMEPLGKIHNDICTYWRPKFSEEPPSLDLMCDGENMVDIWHAYSFDWDTKMNQIMFSTELLAKHAGSIFMGGSHWPDGTRQPYYPDRIRWYLRALDKALLVNVDMGPGVERTVAAAYPRWAMYEKKNRQAYDPKVRVKHTWIGLRLTETLHMVNHALRLAAQIEDRLPVYRAVYEESQSRCYEHEWLKEDEPSPNLFQRALLAIWDPTEDPRRSRKIPCLPRLPSHVRSAEKDVRDLRNYTIPVVEALARVEALRCGLRQINDRYMPRGGFPGIWGSTSKQCGQDTGGSPLLRLWKWFVAGEAWPQAARKSCHGSVDGETCLRTDYGTVASWPPSHVIFHQKWLYPSRSNCLLGAVKSCGALSTDPFWHIRNAQVPDSSHERDTSVMNLYGLSDQPLKHSSTLASVSKAPLRGERRRKYNEWKLRARGKMPSACQIAKAMAGEAWHWVSGYLVVPFRLWQFLVAFSRGCGQYAAAMMWPLAQPVILPSPETVYEMTHRFTAYTADGAPDGRKRLKHTYKPWKPMHRLK